MIYTLIAKGRSYDLPPKTLATTEKLDEAANIDSVAGLTLRDKYKKVLDACIAVLGREITVEILGSADIDMIDLGDVTLLFRKIIDSYNKPLEEYNRNASRDSFEALPIDEIRALAGAAKDISQLAQSQPAGPKEVIKAGW